MKAPLAPLVAPALTYKGREKPIQPLRFMQMVELDIKNPSCTR